MKKALSLLSLLIVASIVLSACAPTEVIKTVVVTEIVEGQTVEKVITATPEPAKDPFAEPVTIQFTTWLADPLFDEIIAAYKTVRPNVTVELTAIPVDQYITKVAVQLAGSNPPDIGWQFERVATSWIDLGAFAPITSVKEDAEFNFGEMAEAPLALWTDQEEIYGIPFSTSPFFISYNVDLYEEAGLQTPKESLAKGEWTWERLAADAAAIDALGDDVYGFVPKDNLMKSNPWMNIMPAIWAYGGDAWDRDGTTCQLSSPESVEAIKIYQKMFIEGGMVPLGEEVKFANGNVGIHINQLGRIKDYTEVNFEVVPTPSGPEGFFPAVGQAAVVVFNASKHPEVAMDFLKFFTNEENSLKLAAKFPQIRQSVLDTNVIYDSNPTIPHDDLKAAVVDSIVNGTVLPSHANFEKIDLTMQPFFERIWNGADAAAELAAGCEAIQPFLNTK